MAMDGLYAGNAGAFSGMSQALARYHSRRHNAREKSLDVRQIKYPSAQIVHTGRWKLHFMTSGASRPMKGSIALLTSN
jgi:hypothetical protein